MASTPPGGASQRTRPVVYMHVGAAKSGTTYLQQVLWHNRNQLRDAGILYPGKDFAAHVRAAFDLRHTFFRGASDPAVKGAWGELVDEARDWPGAVIISQELFAPTRAAYVQRALADLDFADVHVVFTARDLGRQIPAHWQEDVKNRFTTSFDEFLSSLRRQDWRSYEVARLFWGLQDPVAVLARWGASLPPERVHVVTLPRPGAPRDLLWRRFSAAVGISPDDHDLSGSFSNPSLGLAETQFLRAINNALDENRIDWHTYNDEVKLFLAQEALIGRPGPLKIELPAEHLPWATERAIEMVEDLRAAGYDVQGDLYDLIPMPSPTQASAPHPDEPRWADMAEVGIDAIAALLQRIQAREKRVAEAPGADVLLDERLELLQRDTAALLRLTGELTHDASPLAKRAAQSVTERYPAVRQLRGAYRRIQAKAGQAKTDQAKTSGSAPPDESEGNP